MKTEQITISVSRWLHYETVLTPADTIIMFYQQFHRYYLFSPPF